MGEAVLALMGTVIMPIFVVVVAKVVLDAVWLQFSGKPFAYLSWFWGCMLIFVGIVLIWISFDVYNDPLMYFLADGTLIAVPILLMLTLAGSIKGLYTAAKSLSGGNKK